MELDDERCPKCGALYRMVGRTHNCRGKSEEVKAVGFRPPEELDAGSRKEPSVEASGEVRAPRDRAPIQPSSEGGKKDHQEPKGSVRETSLSATTGGVAPSPSETKSTPIRKGRPLRKNKDKTLAATKPWELAGMSRATWFKRKAEGKL